jgi:hypothetical protein
MHSSMHSLQMALGDGPAITRSTSLSRLPQNEQRSCDSLPPESFDLAMRLASTVTLSPGLRSRFGSPT